MVAAIELGDATPLVAHGRAVYPLPDRPNVTILVLLTRAGVFAVENRCPHMGRALSDARIRGRRLTCLAHGRSFDLGTGTPLSAGRRSRVTTGTRVRTFRAWLSAGRVFIVEHPTHIGD
jgi:nitrite reductase/ring-hydroxylating ferredoxin subunit